MNGKFPDPPSGGGGIGSGGSQVSATCWPDRDKMTWHLPFVCVAIGKTQVAPKVICMYRLVCVCKDFQTKLCVVQEGDVARRGMEDVIARLKAHRQDLLPRLPGMWGAKYQATFNLYRWLLHSGTIYDPATTYGWWTTPRPGAFGSYLLPTSSTFFLNSLLYFSQVIHLSTVGMSTHMYVNAHVRLWKLTNAHYKQMTLMKFSN